MADVLSLDGDLHTVGAAECPKCHHEKSDPCKCGGRIHSQSVYGPAIIYVCDRCDGDKDGIVEEPRG